jgi:hypothetical protein
MLVVAVAEWFRFFVQDLWQKKMNNVSENNG